MSNIGVSVIIPVYNRAKFLARAVNSVLQQTFTDFELIVVDDGSHDSPEMVMEKYSDSRVKILKQKNAGVSSARNTGVLNARYDLIAFLDSDDEWKPAKLDKQIRFLIDNPECRICYTGEDWIRDHQPFAHAKSKKKYGGLIFEYCLKDCFIGCSTVIISKSVFFEAGMFDESFPVCEDYDLWLKISAKYPIFIIKEPLIYKHGGHEGQLSRIYWGLDRFRIKSIANIMQSGKLNNSQVELARKVLNDKCAVVCSGSLKRKNYRDFSYYLSLILNKPCLENKSGF